MQTRAGSMVESAVSTAVGFVLSFVVFWAIAPLYGMPYSHSTNAQFIGIFTVVSVLRGYVLRRVFNQLALRRRRSDAIAPSAKAAH